MSKYGNCHVNFCIQGCMVLLLAQVLCSLAKPDPRSYKKEEFDFARLAIVNGIFFMDKNVMAELVLDLSLFAPLFVHLDPRSHKLSRGFLSTGWPPCMVQ